MAKQYNGGGEKYVNLITMEQGIIQTLSKKQSKAENLSFTIVKKISTAAAYYNASASSSSYMAITRRKTNDMKKPRLTRPNRNHQR